MNYPKIEREKIETYSVFNIVFIKLLYCHFDKMNETLKLTRYLYNVKGVFDTLKVSIQKNRYEEALFWSYELYYSGIETELIDFLFDLLKQSEYTFDANRIIKFLIKKQTVLQKTNAIDLFISIFIKNMIIHMHHPSKPDSKQRYVVIRPHEITCYQTEQINPVYKTLSVNCKHSLLPSEPFISDDEIINIMPEQTYGDKSYERHDMYNEIRNDLIIERKNEYLDDFYKNWLFYACRTPIWKNRLLQYGGKVDLQSKFVLFERTEDMESFYELYGFEPDEQPTEVITRIIYYLE